MSDLVGNPEDPFSGTAAHIVSQRHIGNNPHNPNMICHKRILVFGFLTVLTQIGLFSHRKWLKTRNFRFEPPRGKTNNVVSEQV